MALKPILTWKAQAQMPHLDAGSRAEWLGLSGARHRGRPELNVPTFKTARLLGVVRALHSDKS